MNRLVIKGNYGKGNCGQDSADYSEAARPGPDNREDGAPANAKKERGRQVRRALSVEVLARALLAAAALALGGCATSGGGGEVGLDAAIAAAGRGIEGGIGSGAKIAILNVQSDYPALSEYVIDELTKNLLEGRAVTVVDRRSLVLLEQELQYQYSGEVSARDQRRIGQQSGAQAVVSGAVVPLGRGWRLRLQMIDVERAEVLGTWTANLRRDARLAGLLPRGGAASGGAWEKYRRVYAGARGGLSPHWYEVNTASGAEAAPYLAVEGAAQVRVQLADLAGAQIGFQAEAGFSSDQAAIEEPRSVSLSSSEMQIPLLLRLSYPVGPVLLGLFAGPSFAVPLGKMTAAYAGHRDSHEYSAPAGLTAGGSAGIRLGPGILFVDLRGGADFGYTRSAGVEQYHRNLMAFSAGYEIGFGYW